MWLGNLCLTVKRQKTMKKIFNLILAALVIIGAASCTKNEEIAYQGGEGLSFYAEIVNGDTRAYIDDTDGDKKWNTIWENGDVISVSYDGRQWYDFAYNEVTNKFTCTADGVTSLLNQLVFVYPVANMDSKAGKKGWSFNGIKTVFTADMTIEITADTSFFRYTYNGSEDITFTVTADKKVFVVDSDVTDTVTISGVSGENFVAFWPNNGDNPLNATLSYSIGGVKCKEANINLVPGKVYNLGTLTEPVATEYGVVGSFQKGTAWDVANPVTMYEAKDGWCVARNVELYKSDEFKIVKGNSWDGSYGLASVGVLALDEETAVVNAESQNMKAAKNGKFDISLNATTKRIMYTCVEEYTGTVDITINNIANWSPLYITLKKGENVIADKQLVTDNKFAVDMNYIAEELSYTLSNDGTKTKSGIVNITKDGATITLEENVVLLKIQLDTDNSKKWWGNTMKIHAWSTGTSFDTSWPGNTMKSEGNYTWSIEVPSELVGKTIDFLVHNGNGWQCPDAKVTISAEGNTLTGSSIGI